MRLFYAWLYVSRKEAGNIDPGSSGATTSLASMRPATLQNNFPAVALNEGKAAELCSHQCSLASIAQALAPQAGWPAG
jgi:hypothetical protein